MQTQATKVVTVSYLTPEFPQKVVGFSTIAGAGAIDDPAIPGDTAVITEVRYARTIYNYGYTVGELWIETDVPPQTGTLMLTFPSIPNETFVLSSGSNCGGR